MKFKKSLGQNLLIDKNILKKITSLTSFKDKEIIEIGAGTGNFGTGIRHRTKFVIALLLLAAPLIPKLIISKKKKIK